MKVVYVSDNRVRGNYGCRATSTALSQLIRQHNEIVGTITGRYTNFEMGPLFYKNGYPESLYKKLGARSNWSKLQGFLSDVHRAVHHGHSPFFYSKYDFVRPYDLDATIKNLIRCLPANPQIAEYDLRQYDFDAVVVNGEGSFIFATPPWRESVILLTMMHWAQLMGKKVYFVNAMLSDDPYSPHNDEFVNLTNKVLSKADYVSVRDPWSLKYAQQYFPDVKTDLIPDALFTWYPLVNDSHVIDNGVYYMGHSLECDAYYQDLDFTRPYICISGSSARSISNDRAKTIDAYSELAEKVKDSLGCNVFLVDVCEGDDFLIEIGKKTGIPVIALDTPIVAAAKILANARLYISGRYHPSIMASLGGTPCIFMSSNSHKSASLQELLNYKDREELPVIPTPESIDAIIKRGDMYLSEGNNLRETIQSQAHLLASQASRLADVIS